jgi:lipopolysaccharide/colanic/teichoic acid biosynthesis glycosyltransferase
MRAVSTGNGVGSVETAGGAEAARFTAVDVAAVPTTLGDEFSALLFADPTAHLMAVKRAVDVFLSAAALIVLLPLFAILAALIKLTSAGPVFFAQRRVGHYGRIFKMLKFRSMVVNAEEFKPRLAAQNESSGPVFKMRRDPRVTAIGRFIRMYSLDELPQLINVLLGDMSIVGPRPPVPSEVVRYEPWQYRRFAVRPGLTCLWQASPERYRISFDDWMQLDLSYIDHWSLRLDFDLILQTFGVVLRGTGE